MGYISETDRDTVAVASGTLTIMNYSIKYEYDNMGFLSKRTTAKANSSYVETESYNNTYENGNIIKSSVTISTILNNGTKSSRSYERIHTYYLGAENTLSNTRFGVDFLGKSNANLTKTITINDISGNSPSSTVTFIYDIKDGYAVKETVSSGETWVYTYQ